MLDFIYRDSNMDQTDKILIPFLNYVVMKSYRYATCNASIQCWRYYEICSNILETSKSYFLLSMSPFKAKAKWEKSHYFFLLEKWWP